MLHMPYWHMYLSGIVFADIQVYLKCKLNKKRDKYMNLNNFTIKAQEAVEKSIQLVTKNGQQTIEAVHLLKGVILTGESVTNFIFQKLGVNIQDLEANHICRMKRTLSFRKLSLILRRWAMIMYLSNRSFWRCLPRRVPLRRF